MDGGRQSMLRKGVKSRLSVQLASSKIASEFSCLPTLTLKEIKAPIVKMDIAPITIPQNVVSGRWPWYRFIPVVTKPVRQYVKCSTRNSKDFFFRMAPRWLPGYSSFVELHSKYQYPIQSQQRARFQNWIKTGFYPQNRNRPIPYPQLYIAS